MGACLVGREEPGKGLGPGGGCRGQLGRPDGLIRAAESRAQRERQDGKQSFLFADHLASQGGPAYAGWVIALTQRGAPLPCGDLGRAGWTEALCPPVGFPSSALWHSSGRDQSHHSPCEWTPRPPKNQAGTAPNQARSGTLQTACSFLPSIVSLPSLTPTPALSLSLLPVPRLL